MSHKDYIGISISESQDIRALGLSTLHLQDAAVECARHLLQRGYGLAYGGDLTYDVDYNFASLLFQLARTYSSDDAGGIRNYAAFPLNTKLTEEMRAEVAGFATIIDVIPTGFAQWKNVRYEAASELEVRTLDKLFDATDDESKEIWSESLTQMRRLMTEEISARIIAGGKTSGYRGRMPGIIEEALYCVENNIPVLVDGRFGGASAQLANWLQGQQVGAFPIEDSVRRNLANRISVPGDDLVVVEGDMPTEKFHDIISWALL
jgi:hypothetical protein